MPVSTAAEYAIEVMPKALTWPMKRAKGSLYFCAKAMVLAYSTIAWCVPSSPVLMV